MSKIILPLSILLACIISASAQNTISFDNQSGEPALVKLIGSTANEIEVPDGTKRSVQASAGKYFIKVRYGIQGKYHYTKGQEFTVDQTATTTSEITITLHKVVNGNYDTSPINEQEFGVGNPVKAATNRDNTIATTPDLDSPNASERVTAVTQLKDQTVLAKVALKDKSWAVRKAAVHNLTDQTVLAKIAIEDDDNNVREAAVEKLTDQALLVKIAVEDKDEFVRGDAQNTLTDQSLLAKMALEQSSVWESTVEKLTNQSVLAKIALEAQSESAKRFAVKTITDQTLLAKIAVEDKDEFVRGDAFDKLTNQSLFGILVTDKRVPLVSRHLALGTQLLATNIDFTKLAGKLNVSTFDALEAMGRMQIALADPIVTSRMPNITLEASIKSISQDYTDGSMQGERVTFTLKRESEVLITQQWETGFPPSTYFLGFLCAKVDISGMMARFFGLAGFSTEDLIKLSQSEVPEIRAGAVGNFQDQTLILKVALEDKSWSVRETAVDKLTDQAMLAKLAVEDGDNIVRFTAVEKITDQTLLENIAVNNNGWADVGVDAVKKLTDQAILAKVAVQNDDWNVRETAVKQLTDEILLANIAVEDKNSGVRYVAKNRLDEIRAGKP